MFLSICQMELPILVMLGIGVFCRRKILSEVQLTGIRNLVSNVLLPVVLFNAFFTAEYSGKILLTGTVVYISCAMALTLGFALRRFVKPYEKFMPFLLTNFEGGMLGYALFGLLYPGMTRIFAMVDIGQTLSAYTVFMVTLKAVSGGRTTPKELARNALTTPAFLGALLGVVLGASGIAARILASPVAPVITDTISFIANPVSALILIIVGYDLTMNMQLLRPVVRTVLLRLLVMASMTVIGYLIIFHFIPFEKPLFTALLLGYALPAPFIIPLYADVGKDGEYISASVSAEMIFSILLFAGIAAYTIA